MLTQAERIVVGVADLAASRDDHASIVTYALGSCLGLMIHDPVAHVGAMLHVMLPDSRLDASKAASNPAMFVDTGVPRLFMAAYRLGAVKERIVVKVVGGAAVQGGRDMFEIGKRNMVALRRILWKNNVMIQSSDVGGNVARTATLHVGDGRVTMRIDGTDKSL
jgi:chemotaxis protein CheD